MGNSLEIEHERIGDYGFMQFGGKVLEYYEHDGHICFGSDGVDPDIATSWLEDKYPGVPISPHIDSEQCEFMHRFTLNSVYYTLDNGEYPFKVQIEDNA